MKWLFASDLHGSSIRFRKLFLSVRERDPPAVLLGGDLFPRMGNIEKFLEDALFDPIRELKVEGISTEFIVILGNDDPRAYEHILELADKEGLIHYIPMRVVEVMGVKVAGYPFIHPSPFLLKDWEMYDVSRHLDPGCVSPLEGTRTYDVDTGSLKYRTIMDDLDELSKMSDPEETVYLFHSPPYMTDLDMSYIGGQMIDHVPLDPHIGSVAVKRFIEERQPPVTLHGHVHESFELTGSFHNRIGTTCSISAAGTEKGLVLVTFDPAGKERPEREVLN
ncbi:MAG: metallophosphoesterase [Candidatus Thermoplasmatota archaeon]|nr:metallophosphoesterase [Candidatus Thermoplasmatota archaeon]